MEHKQYLKMADVITGDVVHICKDLFDGDGNLLDSVGLAYAAHAINSHDELVAENALLLELLDAAKAVVARWDTPNWKDAEPTAAVIGRLRAVINKFGGSTSLTKQQAAAEFVSFYRWCKYHNIALHSDVMVLGWRCGLDVVSTENEEMIMNAMRKI